MNALPHSQYRSFFDCQSRLLPAVISVVIAGVLYTTQVGAQSSPTGNNSSQLAAPSQSAKHYQLPAGKLGTTLNRLAQQTGIAISFNADDVEGIEVVGLKGSYSLSKAFSKLLAGSGLSAQATSSGYVISRVKSSVLNLPPVVVSGEAYSANQQLGVLPAVYSDVRVARGSHLGVLGSRDVMDTPFSTTSYTAQAIENQNASSVMGILRNDPSVRNVFPESGLGEYLNVRGFFIQSHELALNGLYGLVPHNRTATEMLERVEVFKGPAALLFGMSLGGTVGGVINLVPKRAGDKPLTRLTAKYKENSDIGLHLDLGRRFGADQQYGVRVNLLGSDGDTVIDEQSQKRKLSSIAFDVDVEGFRASIDAYDVKDDQQGGAAFIASMATPQLPRVPTPNINIQSGAYAVSNSDAVIASLEFDFNEHWMGFATSGRKHQDGRGYLNGAIATNLQPTGDFFGLAMNINNFFDVSSSQLGLRGSFRTGEIDHSLVINADQIKQESGSQVNRTLWASNLNSPTKPALAEEPAFAPKKSDDRLTSFAITNTMAFSSGRYQLTLGVRKQNVKTKNFDSSGVEIRHYDDDAISPGAGLVVKPWSESVSLYANYMEGLSRGPTVSDSSAVNFGEVFAPYSSKQFEFGIKWNTGRFLNTFSMFEISQPILIRNPSTNTYGMDGESRNRGIEWTIAGELARGLRLLGGAAYTNAKLVKSNGGLLDGNHAIGIPKWQFNLVPEWDLAAVPGLTLNASFIYTGDRYADALNKQELDAWMRVDLGARYKTKLAGRDIVLRGFVLNALDKHYWAGSWYGFVSVGPPRTVQLSVQIDF